MGLAARPLQLELTYRFQLSQVGARRPPKPKRQPFRNGCLNFFLVTDCNSNRAGMTLKNSALA
jgi:hypothetical protein